MKEPATRPVPPARYSTTTLRPMSGESLSATTRTMVSIVAPAGTTTIIRSGCSAREM
ncbi:hypothetical protein ACFXS9_02140 [Bradyrhizobium sp. RDI18]